MIACGKFPQAILANGSMGQQPKLMHPVLVHELFAHCELVQSTLAHLSFLGIPITARCPIPAKPPESLPSASEDTDGKLISQLKIFLEFLLIIFSFFKLNDKFKKSTYFV